MTTHARDPTAAGPAAEDGDEPIAQIEVASRSEEPAAKRPRVAPALPAADADASAAAPAAAPASAPAAGLGDIGSHFPDTDPTHAGADSIELLRAVGDELRDAGWTVANVDCSVVCDTPKIAPHRDAMQQRLSDAAGGPVTVKGKRPEGIGSLGRGDGVACWAVALIEREEPR